MDHQRIMDAMTAAGLVDVRSGDVYRDGVAVSFRPVVSTGPLVWYMDAITRRMDGKRFERAEDMVFYMYLTDFEDGPQYIVDFENGDVYWDGGID